MAIAYIPPVPRFVADSLGIVLRKGHLEAEVCGVGLEPLEGDRIFKALAKVGFRGAAVANIDRITGVVFAITWGGADFCSFGGGLSSFCFDVEKYVLLVI